MKRSVALVLVALSLIACDDDEPTGLTDLADVAGEQVSGIDLYGYLDNGGVRLEFEPANGPADQGIVLYFE